MFLITKQLTKTERNDVGVELTKKTRTIYFFEGQKPDSRVLHESTQKLYKKLYQKQEEAMVEKGRPVTIFEVLGLTDNL